MSKPDDSPVDRESLPMRDEPADVEPSPVVDGGSATFRYENADGELVYEVLRAPGKQFSVRRPDGKGGWIYNLDGVERVPYRLPILLETLDPETDDEPVIYIVEGEKDVESLARISLTATTSAGGASWKWPPEWAEYVRGSQTVFLLADNDDGGRKANHQRADTAALSVVDVRVLDRIPEVGEHGDVSDYLALGHTATELRELVEREAVRWEPPAPVIEEELDDSVDPPSARETATKRFVAGDVFILDRPLNVLATWGTPDAVLWAEGESLELVGPIGVGKTTLGGQLTLALIGLRSEVLGYPVTPRRRVLYLAADRPSQVARSFRRMVTEAERAVLNERLVIWKGPPARDLAKHPDTLLAMAREVGADTVVIDSLKDVAHELSSDETGSGLNAAIQTALVEDVAVLALHHQRKGQAGSKPTTLEDVYGSTWITAGAGSIFLLWGAPGDAIVQMIHLKQPVEPVGPLEIEHDHDVGITSVRRGPPNPLTVLRNARHGMTGRELAVINTGKAEPNKNEVRHARRQLDRLTSKVPPLAVRKEEVEDGATGTQVARYFATDTRLSEGRK